MSGLLHSLRSLFGTPAGEKGPDRPRTRRRAREEAQREEEEDAGGDDDVFSAFGSEEGRDGSGSPEELGSQPVEGEEERDESEGEEGNDGPRLESQPPEEEEGGLDAREARRRRRSRARRQRQQRPTEETKEEEAGGDEEEAEADEQQGQSGSSGGGTLATQPTSGTGPMADNESGTDGRAETAAAEDGNANAPSAGNAPAAPAGDGNNDALAAFFSHLPPTGLPNGVPNAPPNGAGEGPPPTLQGWKDARRAWLREYLARRLVGVGDDDDEEEEEGDDMEEVEEVEEVDACSFVSEVLDEPFGGEMDAEADAEMQDEGQDDGQDVEEDAQEEGMLHERDEEGGREEEDAEGQLQTQTTETQPTTPRAPSSAPRFSGAPGTADSASPLETQQPTQPQPEADAAMDEEKGSPTPPRTQHPADDVESPGPFGGIKRRLGFASSPAEGDDEEVPQPPNKRARGASSQQRGRGRRGTMWDGRQGSIPHVVDTSGTCTRINELDLHCGAVDLSLCRVVRVWESRSTRRMEGMHAADHNEGAASENTETVPPHQAMQPFEHWEDDGPLNTIYKRVLAVEVVQLDDDGAYDENGTAAMSEMSPSVAHLARAAFSDGRHRLARSTARKRRRDARRMKLFLYNRWADAASLALRDVRSRSHVKKGPVPLLVALKDIPAPCVVPRAMAPRGCDPRLAQYVEHPFGDDERGTLSPYCICIGDKSTVKLGEGTERQPLHFDYGGVEVRFAEAPAVDTLAASPGEEEGGTEEAVLTATSVHGPEGYVWGGAGGRLGERYARIGARTGLAPRSEPMADELEDDERNGDGDATPPNAGVAGRGVAASAETTDGADDGANGAAPTAPGEATSEPRADIVRPPSVVPLSSLLSILERNGTKKLTLKRPVYGVVLGFSPPSLTRSMDWMMSVAMIDETLPRSNQPRQESGGEDAPREMHVPSVTLVLFVKDKRRLPVIRAAGDVVYCERVVLQAWNGEPQLCARPFSKVVVVRPGRGRRPGEGDGVNDAPLSEAWATSCSCHDVDGGVHDQLDEGLARGLWVWGQRRLRWHPTMSPHCQLTISQIPSDGNGEGSGFEQSMSGDLTAAVTAIIPVPEHMRRRDTPRGYLRLWDGTGPSRSDPLPLGPTLTDGSNPQQQPHVNDPPEQLLVTIEKIVEDMSSTGDGDAIRAPVALCGRVVNAIIWEENLWNLICGGENSIVDVGSFVRLRNVNSAKLHSSGVSCLSVHVKSSLTPLPFDTYEVRALLKGHDALARRGVPTNPTSAILPARSNEANSARRNDSVQEVLRSNGLSNIQECLETQPPSLFTIQFEVSHTIPACDPTSIDAVEALYAKKDDGSASLRFALHIKDASSEIDVLCLGQAAETMLGITTRDVVEKNREKCEGALGTLKDILAPGSVCEGKVRSMVGKDGKLWFILKSMFCITADM